MSGIRLHFTDVPQSVLDAVLAACSKVRNSVATNLADGPAFAPQVHLSGSHAGGHLYAIFTPRLPLSAAAYVLSEADLAEARVSA